MIPRLEDWKPPFGTTAEKRSSGTCSRRDALHEARVRTALGRAWRWQSRREAVLAPGQSGCGTSCWPLGPGCFCRDRVGPPRASPMAAGRLPGGRSTCLGREETWSSEAQTCAWGSWGLTQPPSPPAPCGETVLVDGRRRDREERTQDSPQSRPGGSRTPHPERSDQQEGWPVRPGGGGVKVPHAPPLSPRRSGFEGCSWDRSWGPRGGIPIPMRPAEDRPSAESGRVGWTPQAPQVNPDVCSMSPLRVVTSVSKGGEGAPQSGNTGSLLKSIPTPVERSVPRSRNRPIVHARVLGDRNVHSALPYDAQPPGDPLVTFPPHPGRPHALHPGCPSASTKANSRHWSTRRPPAGRGLEAL